MLNIFSMRRLSLTYDENMHYRYGLLVAQSNLDRSETYLDSKMPVSFLNVAIPRGIAKVIRALKIQFKSLDTTREGVLYVVETGRFVTVVFSLLLAIYIFIWSKKLYGVIPGIASIFMYVFSPNIIAHSQLVTTDLYAALAGTLSLFYFWKFVTLGGWKRGVVSACILGLSQLAKYTCVFLYPIFFIIVLVRNAAPIILLIRERNIPDLLRHVSAFARYAIIFGLISILIINIGFLFDKSGKPLSTYEFKSDLFKKIQEVPVIKHIPVPLPYPYVQGLDLVKYNEKTGATSGNIYLMGELREVKHADFKGFIGYFFYVFLFKEPIAIQVILLLSCFLFIKNCRKYHFFNNEVFLLVPILFFVVYFNFFFNDQVGLRFLLIIFPLIYIFCGKVFEDFDKYTLHLKSVLAILLLYLSISVLSYFPHYLSYVNEIIWDRKKSYKYIADSNLDWGQNKWYLKEYAIKHPEIVLNPEAPAPGKIVVSVNDLVGVFKPERYKWLRENFEATGHIAYSYLIYDIRQFELEKIERK
jgi:hypothetical protein